MRWSCLGSATPSLESRYNAERGKYTRLELPARIEQRPMPAVTIVDMRHEFLESRKQATFSRALLDAVSRAPGQWRADHAAAQSPRILEHRRLPRPAASALQCVNCSVTLTYHRRDRRMLCHYCNYASAVPDKCPQCASEYLQFIGVGSERVEQELGAAFPRARIARLDRDTVSGKHDYETILSGFREQRFDILVGTQMIAKGHDIPNVTLVGIVNADVGLGLPDFRAAERTFQLLTQAAGRAGRGDNSRHRADPDHQSGSLRHPVRRRAGLRKVLSQGNRVPAAAVLSALRSAWPASWCDRPTKRMHWRAVRLWAGLLNPAPEGVRVMGPAPAPVLRVKSEYRYQMLLKTSSRKRLSELLGEVRRFAAAGKVGSRESGDRRGSDDACCSRFQVMCAISRS